VVIVVIVNIIHCRQVRIQKKVVEAETETETVVVMNHVGVVVVVVAEEVVGVVKVVGVVEEGLAKDPAAATRNLRESMSKMRTHFLRYK
jgi:hypothetical protein